MLLPKLTLSVMNSVSGGDPFNQNSNRSDREKWSTSKGGPVVFETFPVGPNRSIEFWTEISWNFGWMDRTQWPLVTFIFLVAYHFLFAVYSNLAYVTFIFYLNSFSFYGPRWRFVLQAEISGKCNSPLYFCSLSLFFSITLLAVRISLLF